MEEKENEGLKKGVNEGIKEEKVASKSNLPVVQKDKELLRNGRNNDILRRIGKIAKGIGIGVGVLTAGTISSVAIPMIVPGVLGAALGGTAALGGFAAGTYGLFKGTMNIVYREENDLMFVTRRNLKNQLMIYQKTGSKNAAEMQKLNTKEDKAGLMQLQCLVGLSRYKDALIDSPYTEREDGTKVYNQEFATVTHSVNLRTFTDLERLGLIEIIDKNDKLTRTITGKPKEKRSLLIVEKKGFNNKEALDEIKEAVKARDWDKLKKQTRVMEKWTFRLTDKPIDFVDMYEKYQNLIECDSPEEKRGIRGFGLLFNSVHGILTRDNMHFDIGKDEYGRDVILYDREENFKQRVDKEIDYDALREIAIAEGRIEDMKAIREKAKAEREAEKAAQAREGQDVDTKGLSDFDKSLRQGVDQEKVEAVLEEHREEVRRDLSDDGKLNGSTRQTDDKSDNDKKKDLEGTEQSL